MRFVLSFKTGSVEFEIPEAHLKRHPETMLSVMTRPRWAGPEGTPEVQRLEAPETAETYWSDGMAKAVVTLYARETGDQSFESPVELEDLVAIADWLLLPLGKLSEITYGSETAVGNLARLMRAKLYLKLREDRVKTMTGIREAMKRAPKQKYRFGFPIKKDHGYTVNYLLDGMPIDRFIPEHRRISARELQVQENRLGTIESAYEWAQCENMRDETLRELARYGFEASWESARVDPSFTRVVQGHRYALHVAIPQLEPASKRRRL